MNGFHELLEKIKFIMSSINIKIGGFFFFLICCFFLLLFYFSNLLKDSRIMSEKTALNNLFWNGPKCYARSGPLRSEM